jgi:hypothetical protein
MSESNTPEAQQPQAQQVQVQLRDDKAHTVYSNVARIATGSNAEEIMMELATTMQSPERQDVVIMDVSTRVYLNLFAAKRLALTLSQAVQRYEQQFGAIELDPRKRLKQG